MKLYFSAALTEKAGFVKFSWTVTSNCLILSFQKVTHCLINKRLWFLHVLSKIICQMNTTRIILGAEIQTPEELAYSAFRVYMYCQYVCFLGIEPMTVCAANTMLYHWATETQQCSNNEALKVDQWADVLWRTGDSRPLTLE